MTLRSPTLIPEPDHGADQAPNEPQTTKAAVSKQTIRKPIRRQRQATAGWALFLHSPGSALWQDAASHRAQVE